jgi:hypothetical protein
MARGRSVLLAVALLGLGCHEAAAGVFKRYPVKSGMIFYDVNIHGESAGSKTITKGIARLVFDNWGARELKEEDLTETQTGDFNETREERSMNKFDNGTIYTVDFTENTIYKTRDRSIDLSIARGEDLSNETLELIREMKGEKVGKGEVAGFECDLWKIRDQKICLYKGIPLSIVIEQPGFKSEKVALQVVIGKPVDDREFELPDFPVIVDDDYTSNRSAEVRTEDYIASIRDLRKKMKKLGIDENESNLSLSPRQEKEVIDTLGARYLSKQKRLLPKLIVAIDGAIKCMRDADKAEVAKDCIKPVDRINEELGDKTENFDFDNFDESRKKAMIESLKDELGYLEATNDCVQKYDRTSEVIECTEKGREGEE